MPGLIDYLKGGEDGQYEGCDEGRAPGGKSVIPRVFPPKAVRKIYRVISHNLRPIANMNPGFSKSEQVTTCLMLDVKSHSLCIAFLGHDCRMNLAICGTKCQ